jgi:hypothetical protein
MTGRVMLSFAQGAAAVCAAAPLAACGLFFPAVLGEGPAVDGGTEPIAADGPDSSPVDYHAMTKSWWSVFDTTTANPGALGFAGAAFDGRYVYFAPQNNGSVDGVVARFDTAGEFSAPGAWSTFNTAILSSAEPKGFNGAVFDGRNVYFVPFTNGTSSDGLVVRYDTSLAFGAASSWSTFDMTSVSPHAVGFAGATFDGSYVYFVPNTSGGTPSGLVARFHAGEAFDSPSAWSTFDATSVSPSAAGFVGAVFDGRFIYFAPSLFEKVVRYDTRSVFGEPGSWATFATTTVDPDALGFAGAAYDGRFVYFVPHGSGIVVRYDTAGSGFEALSAWSTFDVMHVNPRASGFFGAAFDGRYVYFVPSNDGSLDGLVVRLDTTGSFTETSSWSTFDATALDPSALGFAGAVFDDQFVYFVPGVSGKVTRFHARSPPGPAHIPDSYGSFF